MLSASEIRNKLKRLDGWKRRGRFITKTFEFDAFLDGIAFLNRVARVAEAHEHHPDISVRYTTIKLSVQTHSEGGVTNWDIGLAKAIDRLGLKGRKK